MRALPASPVAFLGAVLGLAAGCGGSPASSEGSQGAAGSARGAEEAAPQDHGHGHDHPADPPRARRDMLEELRAAHRAPHHPSDGNGRAWLELAEGEDGSVRASQRGSWTVVYEAGSPGVAEGGFVRLLVPPFWEWSHPQHRDPSAPGHVVVESLAEGVEIDLAVWERWIEARVRGRTLAEGERVRFTYGAGEAGAVADRYAERDMRFWVSVDGDGDRTGVVLVDSPAIRVLPGRPARLLAILPSVARPGESVPLRVAFLDRVGNAWVDFEGTVELAVQGPAEAVTLPAEISFAAGDEGTLAVDVSCAETGVVRVLARTAIREHAVQALSNPMLVSEDAPRVRWGDVHGHSNWSDGTGTPDDYFRYARDVAALDVVALTDHDHWGVRFLDENPELWEELCATADRFHEPGRFVTIQGYEWTNWIHGHRHVLYFGEEGGPVLSSIDPDYETPQQLWDGLRERGLEALTFAHHSAGGPIPTNWDYAPDPELEPVTEIVSVHGSSEAADTPLEIYRPMRGNHVRDALDRGYRLGFIGSGDSHDGHPGMAHVAGYTTGLAALVAAEDLTRDGVLGALRERRCYATNGARILLQCALDSHRMGDDVPVPAEGGTATLFFRVLACGPLDYVDVVRRDETTVRIPAEGEIDVALALELEGLAPGGYVYVRAVQEDEHAAWSSPFFLVEEPPDH